MDLSIIVVSWNTKELLRRCLRSIYSGYKSIQDRYKVEIIVVDNGSEDGSVEMVKKLKVKSQKLKVNLVENRTNLGFSKANNQGIKKAKGKYILLLNSDTEVRSGALEKLVEFARDYPAVGVVGSKLVNSNGTIQPSVYHSPTLIRAIREYWLGQKGAYEKYAPTASDAVEVEVVTGAAMLISKKVFDKVGLLDERYFMYFEDLDFCRCVKRAGQKVFYLPAAEIIHHHGASGKEIPKETQQWLVESSKTYHGLLKHYLINFVIWSSQKWQKILKRK